MRMTIVRIALSALCYALATRAVYGAVKPMVSTPEQKAVRAARRLKALNETGGFIADPRDAHGKYVFVDCGVGIDAGVIKAAAVRCQNSCMILTEVVQRRIAPLSFESVSAAFQTLDGIMATFLIDADGWPMEVVCPEKRWTVVNVRVLKADAPTKEVFEARVRKMMSRSVGQVFQAGYAFSSVSTMNLIGSVSDLDQVATEGLATECTTVIQATAERFGFRPMKRVLYRKACEEGWAPPPATDFQRSAWDRVHSEKERGPGRALKIVP